MGADVIEHVEVFYIDRKTGWTYATFDEGGLQTSPLNYEFRRSDAVRVARNYHPGVEIFVFNSNGSLHHITTK